MRPSDTSGKGPTSTGPADGQTLVEVVTPRTNAATITPAENLLAAVSLREPFSLEIAADCRARWFLVRSGGEAMGRHLDEQLGVAYAQAELRRLDTARVPGFDPAWRRPDERVAACALVLRHSPYLPLRTFADADVAADRAAHAAQADPVLGLLGGLGALPEGWRALSQLVLRPAPDDWCKDYLRLAVEHPLAAEQAAQRGGAAAASDPSMALVAGLLVAGAIGFQGYTWYTAGDWPRLAALVAGTGLGLPGALWAWGRLRAWRRPAIYDVRLVQEKIGRIAYLTQLRLAVFAPADASQRDVDDRLRQVVAAYRQYNLATGNGLAPRPLRLPAGDTHSLCALQPLRPAGRRLGLPSAPPVAVLNTRELAGLWHLPQAQADLPLLERTTARRRLPLPVDVAHGCPVGRSSHQGRTVPVALPDDLLRRHLLLVAKTRRGKSSLLLRLARYVMDAPGESPGSSRPSGRPCLVLVDPHRDLARAALGVVPPARWGDVVSLDVAETTRPFGLNLLDAGLGWDRDKAVSNALGVFERQFDGFWGPRMEDAFRFALLTLYEANEAFCAAEPEGRRRQHTVLQVPALLTDPAFRQAVLPLVRDPVVVAWWSTYFDRLDRRLQIEVVNPVATKVQRFAGSRAARQIVGQSRSTIDPAGWLRDGAVVVINTAQGTVGESTAALIGGTLLNLLALVVGEQATLAPAERRPATVLVDEFHTMPGADYEAFLSELAKYGASLVLATQSLARLEALDRARDRALRATVFANLDGLFAFHCSAEDARYLVRELGAPVEEADLLELGEHRCYARLSASGERLPVFSLDLDPPPPSDPALAARLAGESAARYGRDHDAVERDLHLAIERVTRVRGRPVDWQPESGGPTRPAAARLSGAAGGASGSGDTRDPIVVGDLPGTPRRPGHTATADAGEQPATPRNVRRPRKQRGAPRAAEPSGAAFARGGGARQVPLPVLVALPGPAGITTTDGGGGAGDGWGEPVEGAAVPAEVPLHAEEQHGAQDHYPSEEPAELWP